MLQKSQSLPVVQNNNMKVQDSALRLTQITLISAIIGFLSVIASPFTALLLLPVLFYPFMKRVTLFHSWITIGKLTCTTFIFGIIDGYTTLLVVDYFKYDTAPPMFWTLLAIMTVYHYFQFQMVNNFHHHQVKWQSFLIYHSPAYTAANCFMLCEHLVLSYFQVGYKGHPLMWVGFIMCVVGQVIRITAFFTCKSNFTHLVRYRKVPGHTLITNGIYSVLRHPSYTGFFYYTVGGQLMVGNFVSMLGFINTLRIFFTERIQSEQYGLINFFPEYPQYKKRTHIWIPFVKDPPLPVHNQSDDEKDEQRVS